jgi:hypothetical protein
VPNSPTDRRVPRQLITAFVALLMIICGTPSCGAPRPQSSAPSADPSDTAKPTSCLPGADLPGSADPWGGCWPGPTNTGWQHTGVTLKKVPDQVTHGNGWAWDANMKYVKITSNDADLDSLDLGCIFTDTGVSKVAITRSRITCRADHLIRTTDNNPTITLTNDEIIGGAIQTSGTVIWQRVNAHDFTGKAAMTGSNSRIENSYIHDNVCNPPDHQSGIGTNGNATNIVLRHNNVNLTPTTCTSGGISNYDDFGPFHNILITNNLINSAGYCLKAGFEDNNAAGNTAMRVINNVFGRQYYPECGLYGPVSNWMPTINGNQWTGNTWGAGPAATKSHNTGDPVQPNHA